MDWIQVIIQTTTPGIEPVSGRLYMLGIGGLEIEDAKDFCDFLENGGQYWDYVDDSLMQRATSPTQVKLYLPDDDSGRQTLAHIKSAMAELAAEDKQHVFGTLAVSVSGMSESDWAENWKQYYKPLPVGKKILIKPEWEKVDNPGGRIVFEINPGLSFGTGTHESTQLCIESLENYVRAGDSVLDLGCGSGILSIIAMLLGAGYSVAVDIDRDAARIASENAAKNGIPPEKYTTLVGDILTDTALVEKIAQQRYDIILANIVADVIIGFAPIVKTLLKPGAVFIASGIITERLDEVCHALGESGFSVEKVSKKNNWAAVVARL